MDILCPNTIVALNVRVGRLLNVVAALVGAAGVVAAATQPLTIKEFTAALGDIIALEQMCPMLSASKFPDVFKSFLAANGLRWELVDINGPYSKDVFQAEKDAFRHRSEFSVAQNCEDALRLYGSTGKIHAGFFSSKDEAFPEK